MSRSQINQGIKWQMQKSCGYSLRDRDFKLPSWTAASFHNVYLRLNTRALTI